MKLSTKLQILFTPIIPILGAIGRHYSPDWIGEGPWVVSSMLSCAGIIILFIEGWGI